MRGLASAFLVVAALTASGCLGGCHATEHRLVWQQPGIFQALAAKATAEALADQTLVFEAASPGLPFDPDLLPVADVGNASLTKVTLRWGGSWSGHATLHVLEDGNLGIDALYDSGDRKARVRSHLDAFLAAISEAPAAERAATADALLAAWDPRSNDIKLPGQASAPLPLRLDDLFRGSGAAWGPNVPGDWSATQGEWAFAASLSTWTLQTDPLRHEEAAVADVADAAAGPVLGVDRPGKEADVDIATLRDETLRSFAEQGLPEPALDTAVPRETMRTCVSP